MPIPSEKDIQLPLLHMIYCMGGQLTPSEACARLAQYFLLSSAERKETIPSSLAGKFDNRVAWARNFLCKQGFIDRSIRGLWKITEEGRNELVRLELISKPVPSHSSDDIYRQISDKRTSGQQDFDEDVLTSVIMEIAPHGRKRFPEDFQEDDVSHAFYEVELLGTRLELAPLSQTLVISPKGYFRYQAKNPPEAKYIIYANDIGCKNVRIPRDNFILFRTVKKYEKYCEDLAMRAFERFLEFTQDESRAEALTREIATRLNLKAKPSFL